MAGKQEQAHQAAGKLSQLLGEVIVHHAPWTAEINEREKWRQTEQFLEGLEAHTAEKIGPVLQEMFAGIDIPDSLRPIVDDAIGPQAQFSAIVTQLFLYGIVSQLLGTSVQPFLQGVSNDLWAKVVGLGINVPVSPAVLATAAGRGLKLGADPTVTVPPESYAEAAKSGVSPDDLNLQASLVGLPPAFQELLEMKRRSIIDDTRLKQGLQEGDFRDDWIDEAVQLIYTWPTPLDFVRAAVQAQMSYDEAAAWAQKTGLDTTTTLPITASQVGGTDDMFGLLWSIAGRPPGPQELARMALRNIIPWQGEGAGATTFQQGIAESDVKTKWTPYLQKLAEYVPPPREVGVLLEHGAITHEQAISYWEAGGVPTELANGYAYQAEQQHVGQEKLQAKGTITTAYYDQLIDRPTALSYLDDLGFRGQIAQEILALQDFRREMRAIDTVARRIESLYGASKLSATDAKAALVNIGIPADQATLLLGTWEILRSEPIRLPTPSEIGLAVKYGTLDQEQALAELAALGYQPRDAAIVLTAHSQVQVTPLPPAGSGVTG